jgi:hypothetical protein
MHESQGNPQNMSIFKVERPRMVQKEHASVVILQTPIPSLMLKKRCRPPPA